MTTTALTTASIEDLLAEIARREQTDSTIHTPAEFAEALAAIVRRRQPVPGPREFFARHPDRTSTCIAYYLGSQRMVHAFVENSTGAVFKAAGWTSPAHKATARYESMDEALAASDAYGRYLYAR